MDSCRDPRLGLQAVYIKPLLRLLAAPGNLYRGDAIETLSEVFPAAAAAGAVQQWLDAGLLEALLECMCEWCCLPALLLEHAWCSVQVACMHAGAQRHPGHALLLLS